MPSLPPLVLQPHRLIHTDPPPSLPSSYTQWVEPELSVFVLANRLGPKTGVLPADLQQCRCAAPPISCSWLRSASSILGCDARVSS